MVDQIGTIWIGLDWGTHSSKWWYTAENLDGESFRPSKMVGVVDSTVYRDGTVIRLVRERAAVSPDTVTCRRLKRRLIDDAMGADYWEARREDTGTSLGDAAVFSLCVLLGDVAENVKTKGLEILPESEIKLCFSLPNWVSVKPDHQKARQRMFETTAIVSKLLSQNGFDKLPKVGEPAEVEDWCRQVRTVRQSVDHGGFKPEFGRLVAEEFLTEEQLRVSWRLAAESSAAGFPELENLLIDPAEASSAQDHWVKLVVVDVGAGSTDVGHFVSARTLTGQLFLNYLPPMATFEHGGEKLTEAVRDHYRRVRHRDVPIDEAEILKLNASDEWKTQPFLREWIDRFAEPIYEYMLTVPDYNKRLGETAIPGLKIVITGGSGLVDGLAQKIRNTVVDALLDRRISTPVATRTQVMPLSLDFFQEPIESARRAVSLGAGNKSLGKLRYQSH